MAALLQVSLRQLAPRLDLSPASLFGYRSGKIPLTEKAWSKLERFERKHAPKAHLHPEVAENAETRRKPTALKNKMIPIVGWAHAGEAENYDELPKSWQNEISSECPDPKAFAVELQGDSMEPRFYDGDLLVVQPTVEVHSGCFVVARFADDGVIFRRLEMRGSKIVLVPLNPQYESSSHTQDEFSWIYPVWARITKMWKK